MKRIIIFALFLFSVSASMTQAGGKALFPTKPGTYEKGVWQYEFRGNNEGWPQSTLSIRGVKVIAPVGTVTNTPVGRFVQFPDARGWLNTGQHNLPLFKDDGTLKDYLAKWFAQIEDRAQSMPVVGFPRLREAPFTLGKWPSYSPVSEERLPPFVKAFLKHNERSTIPEVEIQDGPVELLIYGLDGSAHFIPKGTLATGMWTPSTWHGTPDPLLPTVNLKARMIPPLSLAFECAQQAGVLVGITYGGSLTVGIQHDGKYLWPEDREPWIVLLPRESETAVEDKSSVRSKPRH